MAIEERFDTERDVWNYLSSGGEYVILSDPDREDIFEVLFYIEDDQRQVYVYSDTLGALIHSRGDGAETSTAELDVKYVG